VKREEEKEEKEKKKKKARTTALDGTERLNKAQIIQKQLQSIKESDKQIIAIINELQRNCIYY
jgi:ABC-type iron transport system FetAB ATPase subunit